MGSWFLDHEEAIKNVFPDNVLNETIFPSSRRHDSRYDVVTSECKDENSGSSSSSSCSSNFEDSKRIEDEVVDGDASYNTTKHKH